MDLIIERKAIQVDPGMKARRRSSLAERQRTEWGQIEREAKAHAALAIPELDREKLFAAVSISPTGRPEAAASPLLEVVFSVYEPTHLGIIDYHGANRNYARERIASVKFGLASVLARGRTKPNGQGAS